MARSPHRATAPEAGDPEKTGVRVREPEPAEPLGGGLERLIARAQVVVRQRPPGDPRVRLLQIAVLRRDEILIEALLRRLDSLPPR